MIMMTTIIIVIMASTSTITAMLTKPRTGSTTTERPEASSVA